MNHWERNQREMETLFMKLLLGRGRSSHYGIEKITMILKLFQNCFLMENVDYMIRIEKGRSLPHRTTTTRFWTKTGSLKNQQRRFPPCLRSKDKWNKKMYLYFGELKGLNGLLQILKYSILVQELLEKFDHKIPKGNDQ